MQKKRIFAAIDISDEARTRVANYTETLRKMFKHIPVRWEKTEKLHITLKFVGNVNEIELGAFTDHVTQAAASAAPFDSVIAGTGAFVKPSSRANVLWLGLTSIPHNSADDQIARLAASVDTEAGIFTRRRFNPHLTIARLKDPKRAKELIDHHLTTRFDPIAFRVGEITIYQSTLLPSGSVYTVQSRHRLGS